MQYLLLNTAQCTYSTGVGLQKKITNFTFVRPTANLAAVLSEAPKDVPLGNMEQILTGGTKEGQGGGPSASRVQMDIGCTRESVQKLFVADRRVTP